MAGPVPALAGLGQFCYRTPDAGARSGAPCACIRGYFLPCLRHCVLGAIGIAHLHYFFGGRREGMGRAGPPLRDYTPRRWYLRIFGHVSGHDFSRAASDHKTRRASAPAGRPHLEPRAISPNLSARLKSCPDTKHTNDSLKSCLETRLRYEIRPRRALLP